MCASGLTGPGQSRNSTTAKRDSFPIPPRSQIPTAKWESNGFPSFLPHCSNCSHCHQRAGGEVLPGTAMDIRGIVTLTTVILLCCRILANSFIFLMPFGLVCNITQSIFYINAQFHVWRFAVQLWGHARSQLPLALPWSWSCFASWPLTS